MGLSVEERIWPWLTLHGDLRATIPLDRHDVWGFRLEPFAYGATAGLEFALGETTSFVVQGDWNSSPFDHTGFHGLDGAYSGVTLGFNQLLRIFGKPVLLRFFARENFGGNNGDADVIVGLGAEARF
jgi:hypothetical protein